MAEATGARSWPVRANGLLLILQAAGLAGIAAYSIWTVDWRRLEESAASSATVLPELAEAAEHAILTVLVFGLPAALALLAAVGFLFMFQAGWLLAMIAQGLCLLACLLLFSAWAPGFVYPVMLYCILMVLYLNSSTVRAAFDVRRRTREASRAP